MAGPISEIDEREYYAQAWALIDAEAESRYYAAWLDDDGRPVIESDESHEHVADAVLDAWDWQLESEENHDDAQIVIVRGQDAKEIVFTVWRAEAHRLEHEDDAEKAHDAYCEAYYGGDCSKETYERNVRRGDRL